MKHAAEQMRAITTMATAIKKPLIFMPLSWETQAVARVRAMLLAAGYGVCVATSVNDPNDEAAWERDHDALLECDAVRWFCRPATTDASWRVTPPSSSGNRPRYSPKTSAASTNILAGTLR